MTTAVAKRPKPPQAPRRGIALGQTALGLVDHVEAVPLVEGFRVSVNGLVVDGTPAFAQWEQAAQLLRVAERGIQFAIGDLLRFSEAQLGEAASQLLDATEWEPRTAEVYRWIAGRIAPEIRRMDRLGIRHHLAVATLTPAKQRKWLTEAANDAGEAPWTVSRLTAALKTEEDLPPSAFYVVVAVPTEQKQAELMARLEHEGLVCKATVSRTRKALPA